MSDLPSAIEAAKAELELSGPHARIVALKTADLRAIVTVEDGGVFILLSPIWLLIFFVSFACIIGWRLAYHLID